MKLADYRMEFEGQIEKNAMSWAFRAPDLRNYYATKIQVRKTGNLPTADIVRYAVLNGIEKDQQHLPLPISIRPDTLYHVQMSIRGNQFTTKVNGQVVDSWTDSRLKHGGVGFFSDKGESSTTLGGCAGRTRRDFLAIFRDGILCQPSWIVRA